MRAFGIWPSAGTDKLLGKAGQSITAVVRFVQLELTRTVKKKILQCQFGTFWGLTCPDAPSSLKPLAQAVRPRGRTEDSFGSSRRGAQHGQEQSKCCRRGVARVARTRTIRNPA